MPAKKVVKKTAKKAVKKTAKKTTKKIVKKSSGNGEDQLRSILDNVADGIIVIDERGVVETFNRSAESIFGWQAHKIIGKPVSLLIPAPHSDKHQEYVNRYLSSGESQLLGKGPRQVEGKHEDGSIFPMEIDLRVMSDGRKQKFVGIVRNISERLRTLEQHHKTEAFLYDILDNVVDAIITIDTKGIISTFNKSAERIFGYSAGEITGQGIEKLMPSPYAEEHGQYIQRYLETKKARIIGSGREVVGLRKNGEIFPLDLAVSEVFLEHQHYFTGIVKDISKRKAEQKQLEETKLEAESANRSKSEFLANMSHEIRTPLNAILGYTQILLRDKGISKDQRYALETIYKSGDHLLGLINEILDISKIEAGRMAFHPEDFDLKELVDNLASIFQEKSKEKCLAWSAMIPADEHIWVHGDPGKLRQVLFNLLGNAMKFTDSGGITLKVFPEPEGNCRFEVMDTGRGISPEFHNVIFEPFRQVDETRNIGGTGLGLAISKRQVELMGGKKLEVESAPGKGSKFFFAIPLPPGFTKFSKVKSDARVVRRLAGGFRVLALVADDVKENREVLVKILSSIGVEVIEAEDGRAAVEKTRQHVPDIVFMDIRMPVMDGFEAIAEIRKDFGSDRIKIKVVTASVMVHEQEKYNLLECSLLQKPIRARDVFDCLKNVLGVEFEYEGEEAANPEKLSDSDIDFTKVRISQGLLRRLKETAKSGNITALEKNIADAPRPDPQTLLLMDTLGKYVNEYNLKKVLEILEQVKHE